jgi:prepilin-type processing-associated H-X9-DG protein
MRCWPVLFATILVSCGQAQPKVEQPVSACSSRHFEESAFTVCRPAEGTKIEVRSGRRSFQQLLAGLGNRADQVAFAMNAGMFDEAGAPIGLLIEDAKQVHPINRNEGGGNFHLMPNGVFLVRQDGQPEVIRTEGFKAAEDIAFASQSGPMLVIDGKMHPKFDHDGSSRYVRNGVGISPGGQAVFVVSEEPVSFGKFARFFRDELKATNALYFDGSVSSLWDPANGRLDSFVELGPMVVVFKPGGSAPGREGRATP